MPVVHRGLADEVVDLRGMDERVDGGVKAFRREVFGLTAPWPEPGTPQESFGLLRPEVPGVDGKGGRRHLLSIGVRDRGVDGWAGLFRVIFDPSEDHPKGAVS
jgi:hypothetical protein